LNVQALIWRGLSARTALIAVIIRAPRNLKRVDFRVADATLHS